MGAVTGTEGLRVTHMLYADNLTLTANDPVQLQKMLRRLEPYAARKGLTVNVQKSYIILMRTEIPQSLFFVSTIRSLKREILLPTWVLWYLPNHCDALQAHMHLLHKLGNAKTEANYHAYYQTLIKDGTVNGAASNAYPTNIIQCFL